MSDRVLKYSFGTVALLLFIWLLFVMSRLPGGFILPGYILGGMQLAVVLTGCLIMAGIIKLIAKRNSFLTIFCMVSVATLLIFHYYWYSPTLKIIVPKGYSGQVWLVLSNVDHNILTVDSNGIGYITGWTFNKTYTEPVVVDEEGRNINDKCLRFNNSSFWAKGRCTSTEYSGNIKYLTFKIMPGAPTIERQDNYSDLTGFVDKTKLLKAE